MSIPAFGLGTFHLQGQVVVDAVRDVLGLGYRAIDTAQICSCSSTTATWRASRPWTATRASRIRPASRRSGIERSPAT